MSRRLHSRSRTMATVVVDSQTMDIVHVYVNCHISHAAHLFLMSVKSNLDPAYSDTRKELSEMLQRYQFTETHNVTLRRG